MTELTLLDCVEIETNGDAEVSVIWLHGLGADGHDFAPVAKMLSDQLSTPIRFILPHAPSMPVTINGGAMMPAWYDFLNMDFPRNVEWESLYRSEKMITALIKREGERGIPPAKCFLAGFSQGGVLALRLGLRYESPLAGVLALSTYMVAEEDADTPPNKPDVFLAHGHQDPIIPFAAGEMSRDALKAYGCNVDWRAYPMEHNVCEEEIADIRAWLAAKI